MKHAPIVVRSLLRQPSARDAVEVVRSPKRSDLTELEQRLEAERLARDNGRARGRSRGGSARRPAERRRAEAAEGQLQGEQEARAGGRRAG